MANERSHTVHWNGLSPVCVRSWFCKVLWLLKCNPQIGHAHIVSTGCKYRFFLRQEWKNIENSKGM